MKRTVFTRLTAVVLAALMVTIFTACGAQVPSENASPAVSDDSAVTETVNVATLSGPTGIGMAKLAKDAQTDGKYSVMFAGSPEEIVGRITSGETDVACVPTNLASVLYNKTGGNIRVAAVTTLGVLYLLDATGEINSIADLAGKNIGATGQGSNPEYILNYILEKNGLTPDEDVFVDYRTEHAELASMMISGDVKIAMLPVPFATQVCAKLDNVNVIDLQAEWERVSNVQLAQAVIICSADFAANHADRLDVFLADFAASSDFAVSEPAEAAAYVEELGIIPSAATAEAAIPSCNIVFIDGGEMKTLVSAFLDVLYSANPKSIGDSIPSDDFYYGV